MLLRGIEEKEKDILRNFLYEAIFIPEGVKPPDRSIIEQQELRIYYEDFGTGRADHCMVADDKGYATECLDSAKKIAEQENCYKMMLLTGAKSPETLRFYEKARYNSSDKTAFIQWIGMDKKEASV